MAKEDAIIWFLMMAVIQLSYMNAIAFLRMKQIFISWSNPKGNTNTEGIIRTLKEDLVWFYDWNDYFIYSLMKSILYFGYIYMRHLLDIRFFR